MRPQVPLVSTSAPPRCLDGGDIDLLHRHHRLEGTLCLTATSGKRLGQRAGGDLPGEAPAVLAPTALALLAAIADDRVPVTIRLLLIVVAIWKENASVHRLSCRPGNHWAPREPRSLHYPERWRRRSAPPHARPCRTKGRSCSLASCSCAPCARPRRAPRSPRRTHRANSPPGVFRDLAVSAAPRRSSVRRRRRSHRGVEPPHHCTEVGPRHSRGGFSECMQILELAAEGRNSSGDEKPLRSRCPFRSLPWAQVLGCLLGKMDERHVAAPPDPLTSITGNRSSP